MYHFISFFGILFSPVFPFRFPLIVLPLPAPSSRSAPVRRRPSRRANRVACRISCRCMPASRSSFRRVAACHRSHVLACYPMMSQVVPASPMSVSPRSPCRAGRALSGEPRSADVVAIELTKTAHPVAHLCRNCAVHASPYSAHIIYTRARYYVFIKRRSRRQYPIGGDIGSEVFQNEGILS